VVSPHNLNNEPMLIDVGHGFDNHLDEDATLSDINENSKGLQIHTDCDNDHQFNPSMNVQNHSEIPKDKTNAPNSKT
jgi:hypothetical protein